MKRLDYNSINWSNIVYYDETSPSCLRWKIDYGKYVKNSVAGRLSKGYYRLHYNGYFLCHRIVWIICNGLFDNNLTVDHMDGNKENSKIENLRVVTERANQQNRRRHKNNTSGVTGVSFKQVKCAWVVQWVDMAYVHRTKMFSLKKYGECAFIMACEYRKYIIASMNEKGSSYTDRHGCD